MYTDADFRELCWLVHEDARKRAREDHRIKAAAACEGKDKFQSFEQADKTIGHRLRQFSHAYRCTVCQSWHIGGRRIDRHKRLELAEKRRANR